MSNADQVTYAAAASSGSSIKSNSQSFDSSERRFNLILIGVDESPEGTNWSVRLQNDLDNISSVLSNVDSSFGANSIRDHFRLGKYNKEAVRPRPILIKLNKTKEVASIMSNRRNLPSTLLIKPDLSPAERRREAALMKEQWSLIQSGVDRKSIKIRGNNLLVDGLVHANYNGVNIAPSVPLLSGHSGNFSEPLTRSLQPLMSNFTESTSPINHSQSEQPIESESLLSLPYETNSSNPLANSSFQSPQHPTPLPSSSLVSQPD